MVLAVPSHVRLALPLSHSDLLPFEFGDSLEGGHLLHLHDGTAEPLRVSPPEAVDYVIDLNLAYRWFCRLGLEDQVPNHSTFSKNRHGRFRDCELFRFVFESVVERCISEGLVGGEGFAVDASIIKADANRGRGIPGEAGVEWGRPGRKTRAVREYLDALDNDEIHQLYSVLAAQFP